MTGERARDEGLETPVRRVTRPGSGPDARILAVLAVAVLVVAAGVGLGTPPDRSAASSPSQGTPSAAGQSPVVASAAPTPRVASRCFPFLAGELPAVRLWSTSGDRNPILGVPAPGGAAAAPGPPSGTPGPDWVVPGLERGILLPEGASLVLIAERSTCMAEVTAAVAPADAVEPTSEATRRLVDTSRPADRLDIGGLPLGDWVVQVEVRFGAGSAGGVASVPRVVSGSVKELAPSPQVTPAVACSNGFAADEPPALVLVVDDGPPIPAGGRFAEADPIVVRLSQRLEVRTKGDACANGWTIEVRDVVGNSFLQESYPNPVDNPFVAAQNRWRLTQLIVGNAIVSAQVRFGGDRAVEGAWHLLVETAAVPSVAAIGSNGGSAAVLPGCGQFWALPSGVSAFEPCDFQTIPEGVATLHVAAGEAVRIVAPGWTIADWFGRCGEPQDVDDATVAFRITNGCDLGASQEPGPVAFAPWPGDHLVLVGMTLERAGVTAYGNFIVRVVAGG
jgi:hypothetical protein